MESFRILHISDLHFSQSRKLLYDYDYGLLDCFAHAGRHFKPPYDRELVQQVAIRAYEYREDLDFILITGDIADTGNPGDLDAARRFIMSTPRYDIPYLDDGSFPTLQGVQLPILLLPGNHDRFVGNRRDAGGDEFERKFEDFWHPDSRVQARGGIFKKPSGAILAVIRADFTLRKSEDAVVGIGNYLGQGRAYPDILEELRNRTVEVRDKFQKAAVVWAIHFAVNPLPYIRLISNKLQLIDEENLAKVAEELNIRCILCGHVHEHSINSLNVQTQTRVLCAGSASAINWIFSEKHCNAFHIVEINMEGEVIYRITVDNFICDINDSEFRLKGSQTIEFN